MNNIHRDLCILFFEQNTINFSYYSHYPNVVFLSYDGNPSPDNSPSNTYVRASLRCSPNFVIDSLLRE